LGGLDVGHLLKAGVTTESPTVRLDLESKPETLTIVRGMLGGVAEPLAMDAELVDDLKTAVSEACNNVVLHAYDGDPGPMEVQLFFDQGRVRVVVRDTGVGMPLAAVDRDEGIGFSVIRALTDQFTVTSNPNEGTRVQMDFAAERGGRQLLNFPDAAGPDRGWARQAEDEVIVSLSPVTLLTGVLGRLARALAATAHFSLDRFSDVYLVTDTIAAHAARAAVGERIDARLTTGDRRLELAVGPFRAGESDSLRSPRDDPAPSPLMLLSDEVSVRRDGDGELLSVVVIDHRG
jgi:anti-sigma regulatory factor (Ser/Thr protein kinase)